ncbi:ABC transporter ATP-binding protein oligo/dipeptide transport protein [Bosea sp. LC85]|uniref:ABC transporter ATP-binding protein n=1 Tax=Bosea sp. LC85 TaxID=1502851 RepID=UPI0004E371B3|nr:ABC transporter ATP-binding protein [Bosea sp. LC85]KFC70045.1 ABC transporter ATP-binding protein oligo/dipeptide transport protein [Bosea sp. LC85]
MTAPLLAIENLAVSFRTEEGEVTPVRGVSLQISENETVAVVGESGSGKSVTSFATMGLLPRPAGRVSQGRILFRRRSGDTIDLATAPRATMQALRGAEIAMIFQEPMTSLNPVLTVGEQIAEAVRLHLGYDRRKAWAHAVEMLGLVEIPDAARRASDYPHHMSGGMRQRVMIALALSCRPALLIADEPTTALDVTIQAQVLTLLDRLRRELGMGVLFITHNLGVVAEIADRVTVMYAGEVVESAPVRDLFNAPRHPYTRALLECMPSRATQDATGRRVVRSIPGQVSRVERGCAFAPRCTDAKPVCSVEAPMLESDAGRQTRCLRWRELA